MPTADALWAFLPWGYLLTISLETPLLLVGLSKTHSLTRRFLAGIWLTACTYPIVVLVLPFLVWQPFGRLAYLIVAETFAPLAEGVLFFLAYPPRETVSRRDRLRDFAAIVFANACSFFLFEIWQKASGG